MTQYIHRPFQTFPQIMFDNGVSKQVGLKLKQAGVTNVLFLYDKGIESTGMADAIGKYIEAEGIRVVHCNEVETDPAESSVNRIGQIARDNKVDGIVALGGGSALDTAKGVKILAANEGELRKYFDLTIPLNPGPYFIAIPTTSGTGSESSAGGMIIDETTQGKKAVGGPGAFVNLALIDPELTLSLPNYITMATGFDAVAHSIDGILSDKSNQFTRYQAMVGIQLFRESVEEIGKNPKNVDARSKMFGASTIEGLIIAGAGCSLIHSFAHAFGATYGVAHGNAIAVFMQPVLEAVATAIPDRMKVIVDALQIEYDAEDDIETLARKAGHYLSSTAKNNGLRSIIDMAPSREEAHGIIPLAIADMMTFNSPVELTPELAASIIDRAYEIATELE